MAAALSRGSPSDLKIRFLKATLRKSPGMLLLVLFVIKQIIIS
jgi:hypothetical protein